MKRLGSMMMLFAFVAFSGLGTSHAASGTGCYAYADQASSVSCQYTASGPGVFYASAPSGWRIEKWDTTLSPARWVPFITRNVSHCEALTPFVDVSVTGNVPSVAGDLLKVSVYTGCWQHTVQPTRVNPLPTLPPSPITIGPVPEYQFGVVYSGAPITP